MTAVPDSVYTTTLDNGLKVILKEIHAAAVVTTWAWYSVGSKYERPGITGISHWVEHMLFKGTRKLQKGDIFRLVDKYGGYNNGFTSEDWTVYFETLPADRLDLGLDFEADRMVNSRFDPDEVVSERTVIISEREGGENHPQFLLDEEFKAAAFRVHPYRWSVIGYKCDLEAITRDELYGHYRTYYAPNNCTLIVVGDFDTSRALERIRHFYGDIDYQVSPPALRSVEPPQRGERRIQLNGPGGTAYIEMGFHTPASGHPDTYALLMLDAILSGGKSMGFASGGWMGRSARLHRSLVLEKRVAVSASSSFRPSPDPDLMSFWVTVRNEIPIEEAEKALLEEIDRIISEPVSDSEMEKALKQAASQIAYSKDGVTGNAFMLGYASSLGNASLIDSAPERLAQVTKEDIRRAAATYLTPENRTVGWYIPTGDAGGPGGPSPATALPCRAHGPFFATGGIGSRIQREVTDNGITLLLLESRNSPSITLRGSVKAGSAYEPQESSGVAVMTAQLLQRGTKTRSTVEIADSVESVGASISFGAGREESSFYGKCLSSEFETILETLSDCLQNPAFLSDEIDSLRGEILTRLREQDNNTRSVADRLFMETLFPDGHPYHRDAAGLQETVSGIARKDVLSFYESCYSPAGMIIAIAGDLNFDRARQAIRSRLGEWKRQSRAELPPVPRVPSPHGAVRKAAVMPQKTQTDIILGVPAIPRKGEDFYELDFANLILGRLGLMGRLGLNVRDNQGMAYYAYSSLAAWSWDGFWAAYAGINPANTERAVESILEEIRRICEEPVTDEELEDGIRNQIGSVPLRLETNDGLASLLHEIEYHDLGMDYLERRQKILESMTKEKILTAARRYLSADNYLVAIAGP